MRIARDIRSALSLLTVIPASRHAEEPTPDTVAWFPWVGLVLGAAAWGVLEAADSASVMFGDGSWIYRASAPLAVVILALWALLTRLLHWDGLADVSDAWWGGHDPERRLEIMADSATGAFGATAIVIVVLAQVAGISVLVVLPSTWPMLAMVPVLGRTAALFAAWLGTPARPGGLGARVMGLPGVGSLVVAVIGIGGCLVLLVVAGGMPALVWGCVAVFVAAAVPHLIALRMGGVTGDVMGASVLVTEAIVLLIAALVVTW